MSIADDMAQVLVALSTHRTGSDGTFRVCYSRRKRKIVRESQLLTERPWLAERLRLATNRVPPPGHVVGLAKLRLKTSMSSLLDCCHDLESQFWAELFEYPVGLQTFDVLEAWALVGDPIPTTTLDSSQESQLAFVSYNLSEQLLQAEYVPSSRPDTLISGQNIIQDTGGGIIKLKVLLQPCCIAAMTVRGFWHALAWFPRWRSHVELFPGFPAYRQGSKRVTPFFQLDPQSGVASAARLEEIAKDLSAWASVICKGVAQSNGGDELSVQAKLEQHVRRLWLSSKAFTASTLECSRGQSGRRLVRSQQGRVRGDDWQGDFIAMSTIRRLNFVMT